MRFWNIFLKCVREQRRDLWLLALSLSFAPLLVFIYWLITSSGGSTTYGLIVINQDKGVVAFNAGNELITQLKAFSYENGAPFLNVMLENDRSGAEVHLRNRDAAALLVIPQDFSNMIEAMRNGTVSGSTNLEFVGDLTYPTYTVAAVSAMTVADNYIKEMSGEESPIGILETPLGASAARSEFENYVPGLFIFAVLITLFQASMLVARESEGGKLIRLKLAGISSFEFLGGVSAYMALVAVLSAALTFAIAVALGFRSQGSIWLALMVVILTSLSIIGMGMIVASFAKTVSQAFVIANLPFGILMFLSGAAFPLPRTPIFEIWGHGVAIYDILPPTHAVIALNKIFTLGGGLADITYELVMLIALSFISFGAGVVLFNRMNLK